VRTTVYSGRDRRLSASAGSVRLVPTHLIGPFRVGFLRSIVAFDVHIELPDDGRRETAADQLAADLIQAAAPAFAGAPRHQGVAAVEMRNVTVTRRSATGPVLLLRAYDCETARAQGVTCHKGTLRDGDALVPFAQATLDGQHWNITNGIGR